MERKKHQAKKSKQSQKRLPAFNHHYGLIPILCSCQIFKEGECMQRRNEAIARLIRSNGANAIIQQLFQRMYAKSFVSETYSKTTALIK